MSWFMVGCRVSCYVCQIVMFRYVRYGFASRPAAMYIFYKYSLCQCANCVSMFGCPYMEHVICILLS